jgi:Tol biopolymer transport system component/DNA-binding SARP family transcriptional activator
MLLLRTFGSLALENGGRPIGGAAAQRSRLAILAVLAVAGEDGMSRDRLLALFWPESDADRARGALNQALYALRRDAGEQELTLGTSDLRLNSKVITTDVGDFERLLDGGDLKSAVALYAGPFLDGIHIKDAPEFDRWSDRERDRLAHAYAAALEKLAGSARKRGDPQAVVDWMRKLAAADPLSSRVARLLMEGLIAAGDREAAIRHAGFHAALVRAELGCEPEPGIAAFAEELRTKWTGQTTGRATAPLAVSVNDGVTLKSGDRAVTKAGESSSQSHSSLKTWYVTSGTVIGAVAVLGIGISTMRRTPVPLRTGVLTQITIGQTVESEPSISPDGRFIAFVGSRRGEMRVGYNMRIYVQHIGGGRVLPITTDSTTNQLTPRWSPDGSRIAFETPAGIFVVPALGGTPERLVGDSGRNLRLGFWSHDGRRIAFADTQGVWIRDMQRGTSRLVTAAGFGAQSPSWSPDDATLAFVVGTGNPGNVAPSAIWLVPVTGGPAVRVTDAVHLNTSPIFTLDGRSILYVSNHDGGARDIYQQFLSGPGRPRGAPARLTTGTNATTISLSADGTQLVYGTETMRSNIWSAPISPGMVTPLSAMRRVTSGDQEVECVSVSRDGVWLIYDSNKRGNQDIYKMPLAGGDPVQLTTDPADDFCGMMSSDNREITFYSFRGGGNRRVYTMRADGSGQHLALEDERAEQQWTPDWSPDAMRIAFSSAATGARHTTVISRGPDGQWGNRHDITNPPAGLVRWSPDGRYLAAGSDSGLLLLTANGDDVGVLVSRKQIGDETCCAVAWGPDSSIVYYRTMNSRGDASFWAVPVTGGTPRRLLRLEGPTHASRHIGFGTNGKRIFFTMTSDEASIWLLQLGHPDSP